MKVSELFYALQGEGPSTGIPAVFVRFAACNLNCVWCDSKELWNHGDEYTAEALAVKVIELAGGIDNLRSYNTHVVITGGEPTLQIPNISNFLDVLFSEVMVGAGMTDGRAVFVEMETNGTNECSRFIRKYITQVNCSPKLANSLEPIEKRLNEEALKGIMNSAACCFKFVVSSEDDWKEIEETFIPIISKDYIYLMPKANNREELLANGPFVWDLAAREHVAMSTRLHQIVWDTRTQV